MSGMSLDIYTYHKKHQVVLLDIPFSEHIVERISFAVVIRKASSPPFIDWINSIISLVLLQLDLFT